MWNKHTVHQIATVCESNVQARVTGLKLKLKLHQSLLSQAAFLSFTRVESWHGSVLIPALLFLTPVQSDPLSIARRAGPAQACLGSKPRSTGEGVWSKPSYAPHPTPSSLPTPLLSPKSKNPAPYNLLSSLIQLNSGPTERLLLFTFFTSEGESLQQKGMTSCSPF